MTIISSKDRPVPKQCHSIGLVILYDIVSGLAGPPPPRHHLPTHPVGVGFGVPPAPSGCVGWGFALQQKHRKPRELSKEYDWEALIEQGTSHNAAQYHSDWEQAIRTKES